MRFRSLALGASAVALALTVSACSSDKTSTPTSDAPIETTVAVADTTAAMTETTAVADTSATTETTAMASDDGASSTTAMEGAAGSIPADADFNAADVTFAQNMIAHHQQAVEMATMALEPARGASAKVTDLANRIKAAQGPEIDTMTGWLTSWGEPVNAAMGGMDMSGMAGMDGMMSADDMSGLKATSGAAFDKMWLEMMVRHHEGAVKMSQTEQSVAKNADAKALAGKIIAAQQGEISEMKQLLAG